MTTSTIVKLNAGESLTLLVESSAVVDGNYGKQVQLDGQDVNNRSVTIYLPLESAMRQLERINMTVDGAKGEVLKIEKVAKDGKTFININNAAGQPTNGRGKVATTQPAAADDLPWEREERDKITVHYEKCFRRALDLAKSSGAPLTLEGVSAIAATIFIATKSAI